MAAADFVRTQRGVSSRARQTCYIDLALMRGQAASLPWLSPAWIQLALLPSSHEEIMRPIGFFNTAARHVRFDMGVAALRLEGLASLDARKPRVGRIATRPRTFGGRRLWINARCRGGGSIGVGIADSNGQHLPGFSVEDCMPFTGDSVRHEVTWSSGTMIPAVASPAEYRKLHVQLDNAEMFSFVIDEEQTNL
jgi:hypothetical protein